MRSERCKLACLHVALDWVWQRIGGDSRHDRVQLCRGQYRKAQPRQRYGLFALLGGKAMSSQKVSPNSAEIVAQLEAGRKGVKAKFCLRFRIASVCRYATHFSGNQATRSWTPGARLTSHSLRRASRLGRPLPPFPRDACLGLLGKISVAGKLRTIRSAPQLRVRPQPEFSMSAFGVGSRGPARGSKTTKPSGCNTGQRLERKIGCWTHSFPC